MSYRFYSAILVCLIPFIADARLPDFTDLVEEASSAVVKINVSFKEQDRQGLPSYRGQLPDIFRELLEQQRRSQQDRPQRYSRTSFDLALLYKPKNRLTLSLYPYAPRQALRLLEYLGKF